jgi:hypothetical protein
MSFRTPIESSKAIARFSGTTLDVLSNFTAGSRIDDADLSED